MTRLLAALRSKITRDPLESALAGFALAVSLYVIVAPFLVTRYPPMTDLPFHAAQSSTLRHYFDPAYHFREQFEVHPLAVPYVSMYAIAALFMVALPVAAAVKVAAIVMLALLPIGLSVLFRGMKKSPLLGLAGLGPVWCQLTHWGFLNFVGAVGLFALVLGLTLLVLDAPTRSRRIGLALALVALFFTHIFRFPFGIAAVIGAGVVMYPATRRFRPLLAPLAPALVLFAIWSRVRSKSLEGDFGPFAIHAERFKELPGYLFGGFTDPAEPGAIALFGRTLGAVALLLAAAFIVERRFRASTKQGGWFAIGSFVAVLSCAVVFLGLYLWLPMQAGVWWYVYPREASAACFVALGLLPDLPRNAPLRVALVVALGLAPVPLARVVVKGYREFDSATRDFSAISAQIPQAPKLVYLIFDHSGSTRTTTPFIHLPAWIQAEKGGFLSFHFAMWGAAPLSYRNPNEPGAVVPPPVPLRWEWRPDLFEVRSQGAFFDWFLVRRRDCPDGLFRADPTIQRVDHVGSFWLYRRIPGQGG